jgi:hypothetical protein
MIYEALNIGLKPGDFGGLMRKPSAVITGVKKEAPFRRFYTSDNLGGG